MTAADLAALPDDARRHELVVGALVSEPLPVPRHDRVRRRLERILEDFVVARGLGEIFGEAGYLLARDPDTVRGPDISYVSRERLQGFDDTRFFEGAPDLAVEIRSPSNRPGEARGKVADYLAAGARVLWVVDPETKTVTTYRELLSPTTIGPGGVLQAPDLFPALTIPVASLFGDPHAPGR
jgi:Uma2 family endonuclease